MMTMTMTMAMAMTMMMMMMMMIIIIIMFNCIFNCISWSYTPNSQMAADLGRVNGRAWNRGLLGWSPKKILYVVLSLPGQYPVPGSSLDGRNLSELIMKNYELNLLASYAAVVSLNFVLLAVSLYRLIYLLIRCSSFCF